MTSKKSRAIYMKDSALEDTFCGGRAVPGAYHSGSPDAVILSPGRKSSPGVGIHAHWNIVDPRQAHSSSLSGTSLTSVPEKMTRRQWQEVAS